MKTIFFLMIICLNGRSQSKLIVENYTFIKQKTVTMLPTLHIETKRGWCSELRYNYEDAKTVSLCSGKTFSGGTAVHYSLTPMLGISSGQFTGLCFVTNIQLEWKKFFLSLESQHSKATTKNSTSFFYNWSELDYKISPGFFSGLALQYTRESGRNILCPGFTLGFTKGTFSLPCYLFNPFQSNRYFVLGLSYEYCLKKKVSKKSLSSI